MEGLSAERQIRGVSRVRETEERSTSRCPCAAHSAHRFQAAASRSSCDQRSPKRSTTSCTQATSIALTTFVLLETCFRNQQPAIKQLADGIREIDMGFARKQVVNGVGSRQGR